MPGLGHRPRLEGCAFQLLHRVNWMPATMKIAFTSCFSATVFAEQPVWRQILAHKPDALVLTGDSIYIDELTHPTHPKAMADFEFFRLVAAKYRQQLAQADFAALIAAVPTYAIWDDHDFLWNECYEEKAIQKKIYAGHIRASRALFNAYCAHLEGRQQFPADDSDARLWSADEPAPGYRRVVMDVPGGAAVHLHLTDGRSWRVNRTLLGAKQRTDIGLAMEAAPADTLHLVASGSVIEAHKGDQWGSFEDLAWLRELAKKHCIACLSGDIHANDFHRIPTDNGRMVYDFTASGAAIRRAIWIGTECQNFGLLEIDATELCGQWFRFGQPAALAPVTINRGNWQLQR
jgi:alkaline phosphatase D